MLDRALKNKKFTIAKFLLDKENALAESERQAFTHLFNWCQPNKSLNDVTYAQAKSYSFSTDVKTLETCIKLNLFEFANFYLKYFTNVEEDTWENLTKELLELNNYRGIKYLIQQGKIDKTKMDPNQANLLLFWALKDHDFSSAKFFKEECKADKIDEKQLDELLKMPNLSYKTIDFLLSHKLTDQIEKLKFVIDEKLFIFNAINDKNADAVRQFIAINASINLVKLYEVPSSDPFFQTHIENSPLDAALNHQVFSIDVVKVLLEAKPEIQNDPSLLERAIKLCNIELVEAFIPQFDLDSRAGKQIQNLFAREKEPRILEFVKDVIDVAIDNTKSYGSIFSALKKPYPQTASYLKKYANFQTSYAKFLKEGKSDIEALKILFKNYSKRSTRLFRHHHDFAGQMKDFSGTSEQLKSTIQEKLATFNVKGHKDNKDGEMFALLEFALKKLNTPEKPVAANDSIHASDQLPKVGL